MKKALVTGVSGQDGAYLSNFLLNIGYKVFAAVRRSSNLNLERFNYFSLLQNKNFHLVELDITDYSSIQSFFSTYRVDEIYNLAAQSFVSLSFTQPHLTSQTNAIGPLNLLEAIKNTSKRSIKFYQASTSEMFGKVLCVPQNENTPFYPRSPYGIAKQFAHWCSINYRESYGIFTANGILFNHESPLRGMDFVTRKITSSVAQIKKNKRDKLILGNLDAKRDWGYAGDYVEAMYLMLQQEKPDDYVIATGKSSSVREFVKYAFNAVDIDIVFEGIGLKEIGIEKNSGKVLVDISKNFYRPAEVDLLLGDPTKAKKILKWEAKLSLENIIEKMIDYDLMIS